MEQYRISNKVNWNNRTFFTSTDCIAARSSLSPVSLSRPRFQPPPPTTPLLPPLPLSCPCQPVSPPTPRWLSLRSLLSCRLQAYCSSSVCPCLPFSPNTKRFKRTLIYFNTDTQYANFRGNPLYQATKRHLNNR